MLELALLGLLKEGPMHGYDLRKQLREDFGPLSNLSFGSLYPALARLEASGAVRALTPAGAQHGRGAATGAPALPLTGSLGGERAALVVRRATAKAAAALGGHGTRARKVYEITTRGEELFEQLLQEPDGAGEDARAFSLRLSFARHLSPQAHVRLLERRRMQLTDRLQRVKRSLAAPTRPLDVYERSLAEHSQETVESDLSWIERLLAAEIAAARDEEPVAARPGPGTGETPGAAGTAGLGTTEGRHGGGGHAPRVRTGAASVAGGTEGRSGQ